MNRRARSRVRGCSVSCIPALILACMTACQSAPPDPGVEQAIARSLGTEDLVAFRAEGGPLDEPAGDPERLTASDAVRRAVQSDPALQAALARVRVAAADADQARLLPNPVLNLILKFPEGGGRPNIEAELGLSVISILRIPGRAGAADNRLRAAASEAVTTALELVAEVQQVYAAVQALDELMPVLEERRRLLARLVRIAGDRLEAGEGTRSDVTTLEVQSVELGVEIAEAQRQLTDARLRLSRLIGRPSDAAAWSLDPWFAPQRIESAEAAWVQTALVKRPEVQAVEWELAALGDDLALARLAPLEGLDAGAFAERDDGWSVGPAIAAPIPVFDFGQAARAGATARQIEARHRLTQARRGVVEDVRRAYASFTATQANLERVRSELLPLQTQRRSQAEDAYLAGQADVTALFLAEQDLHAALARKVELERETRVSLVRLERAVGGAGIAAEVREARASSSEMPPQPSPE